MKKAPANTFRQHLAGDPPDDSPTRPAPLRRKSVWGGVALCAVAALVLAYNLPRLLSNWRVEDRWSEAVKAENEGRPADAVRIYDEILVMPRISEDYRAEARAQLASALFAAGQSYEEANRDVDAIAAYQRLLSTNPAEAAKRRVSARLLQLYIFKRDYEQARNYVGSARAEADGDPAALATVEHKISQLERLTQGKTKTTP